MDPEKLKAILDWPQPEGLKAIQRFLGFANFYRQFIKNYSLVVAPIMALTKQGVKASVWPPEAVKALETGAWPDGDVRSHIRVSSRCPSCSKLLLYANVSLAG